MIEQIGKQTQVFSKSDTENVIIDTHVKTWDGKPLRDVPRAGSGPKTGCFEANKLKHIKC